MQVPWCNRPIQTYLPVKLLARKVRGDCYFIMHSTQSGKTLAFSLGQYLEVVWGVWCVVYACEKVQLERWIWSITPPRQRLGWHEQETLKWMFSPIHHAMCILLGPHTAPPPHTHTHILTHTHPLWFAWSGCCGLKANRCLPSLLSAGYWWCSL